MEIVELRRYHGQVMTNITHILSAAEQGDPHATEELLPLVYAELRQLAAQRLAAEKPGQTLDATGLVHEAYLRLVPSGPAAADQKQHWDGRGHFFAAAAEAMRRILVDSARRKQAAKRSHHRQTMVSVDNLAAPQDSFDLLELNDALERLFAADAKVAELVRLRFFGGLTIREAAQCLGVSPRTADHYWAYAKAWLLREIQGDG
ncbi:MAG TPA: ECF-type sigma factor [Pirellulales bacterium]